MISKNKVLHVQCLSDNTMSLNLLRKKACHQVPAFTKNMHRRKKRNT